MMWVIYIMVGAFFGYLIAAVLASGQARDLNIEIDKLYRDNEELEIALMRAIARGIREDEAIPTTKTMSNQLDGVDE